MNKIQTGKKSHEIYAAFSSSLPSPWLIFSGSLRVITVTLTPPQSGKTMAEIYHLCHFVIGLRNRGYRLMVLDELEQPHQYKILQSYCCLVELLYHQEHRYNQA